jgi:peptide-methionine (R)-S-oxide reductase
MTIRPREDDMTYKIDKPDTEWREELDADRFAVLRQAATERPWSGALLDEHRPGTFVCAACQSPLFRTDAKFESGSGWPSFWQAVNPDAVELVTDETLGMVRTEVKCATCGSHLGHLFDDAYQTPTGDRYCMNSLALEFMQD